MNTSLVGIPNRPGADAVGAVTLTDTDAQLLSSTLDAALSVNTRRNYASSFKIYQAWLRDKNYEDATFNPSIISAYLSALATTHSASSVCTARSAILHFAGSSAPALSVHQGLKRTMQGTRRLGRGRQVKRARALTKKEIRDLVGGCNDDSARSIQDRCLLLLSLALGVRSSEAVGLHLSDLHNVENGYDVDIRFSKTNNNLVTIPVQRTVGILDPVGAVSAWLSYLEHAGTADRENYLFRSIRKGGNNVGSGLKALNPVAISVAIRRMALVSDVDTNLLSSHSFRATMATRSLEAGYSNADVLRGRWSENSNQINSYNRHTAWEHPASGYLSVC